MLRIWNAFQWQPLAVMFFGLNGSVSPSTYKHSISYKKIVVKYFFKLFLFTRIHNIDVKHGYIGKIKRASNQLSLYVSPFLCTWFCPFVPSVEI